MPPKNPTRIDEPDAQARARTLTKSLPTPRTPTPEEPIPSPSLPPRSLRLCGENLSFPTSTQSPCVLNFSLASWNIECIFLGLGAGPATNDMKCLVNDTSHDIQYLPIPGAQAEDFVARSFISCPPDLNNDAAVDDTDFSSFLASYEALVVPPADPLADFNLDGAVDDADFVIFLQYYDNLVCPGRIF